MITYFGSLGAIQINCIVLYCNTVRYNTGMCLTWFGVCDVPVPVESQYSDHGQHAQYTAGRYTSDLTRMYVTHARFTCVLPPL